MLIKSIQLRKYKSIVDSIEIDLSNPMITFIGKNGSGKTNILDAIYHTFQRNNHQAPQSMDYHIFLELDEHEVQKYSNFVEITNETNIIEAYREGDNNSPTLQIDRIKSPLMTSMIDNLSDLIHELAEKLRDSLTKFNEVVREFASEDLNERSMTIDVDFGEEDLKNSTDYGWTFERIRTEINQLIENLNQIIRDRVNDDVIILESRYISKNLLYGYSRRFILEYSRPNLTKFETKYITINEDAMKREIQRINKATMDYQVEIQSFYDQLLSKIEMFNSILSDHDLKKHDESTMFESISRDVISACSPKIYYLTNESNQLLFKKPNEWSSRQYSLDERVIIETFVKFNNVKVVDKHDSKSIEEWKLNTNEKKELAKQLEVFINANLPNFERGMIQKIQVNDELAISIVEKSGDIVPLNQANSGRRWYFTYFFVKGCLRPGDILILDEPASNLHPEAQIQIRKDIEETAKNNKVIWSTHSPYLISPNSAVYYVKMEDGTRIYDCQNMKIHSMLSEMGIKNLNTLIGDALINSTLLPMNLVGANIKARLKEKQINQSDLARSHNMDPSNFYKKLKGEYLTLDDIKWICTECKIDIVEMMFQQK